MRPTLLQHAGALAPILPALAVLALGGRATRARRWVGVWCMLFIVQDAIGLALGSQGINNLWVSHVFLPIIGGVGLWALAYWQPDDTTRAALRFAIPLVVVVSIGLAVVFDDRRSFSLVASPFNHMVLLLAAVWTFLRLSLSTSEPLLRQDWFWISGGIMLIAATGTAIGPLAWYFLGSRVDLLHALLNVRAAANVAAFAAITWGILCQRRRRFSGGSLSPPSSQWSSSSAGSSSPW